MRWWSRTPGRRGAGPAGSGPARRLCAAGPRPVAGGRPEVGHRHPQQPRSPTVLDRAAGRAGPAAPPARPGPRTAAVSWPGPAPTASRPKKPWPPTSSPPVASRPGCLAGCAAAATSRRGCRVGWRWPRNRPTGLMTGSASCASTSNVARAGWRPMPTSASSIGRWCEPWPGSDAPPDSRSKLTVPAMSWRPWGRCRSRLGAGGPGVKPRPTSSTTGTPTRSPTPTMLGLEPHAPGQRADRQRVRTAIDRVQAKQRAADRGRERQPTSERTNQPRPHQQRGRSGPERAAG